MPASNPYEVRLAEIRFLTVMAEIALAAALAENEWRARRSESPAYREADIVEIGDKLRKEVEALK